MKRIFLSLAIVLLSGATMFAQSKKKGSNV